MSSLAVSVRWGAQKLDVELNSAESPEVFKGQLYALTGVPPDRQKLMFKGKTIGDSQGWADQAKGLKDGVQFLLMGSADVLPTAPVAKPIFMEDMTEEQFSKALKMPAGLKNLGNSCYLNATLQCFRAVPELRDWLKKYSGRVVGASGVTDGPESLTAAVRDVFNNMEGSAEVTPFILLQVLHTVIPRFAERGENGGLAQQDANECWVELMRMFQQKLTSAGQQSLVTQYFGGTFDVTMKCQESPDELESHSTETFLQLSCFLSQEVKYLQSGLKAKLVEEIVKFSPSLERDAKYERISLVSRLPQYLSVQMVRFFYKERENVNAKMLKDVKFPISLDMFDLCTPALQQKLLPMRIKFKELEDLALERQKSLKLGETEEPSAGEAKADQKWISPTFEDDTGSNASGFYELRAVLTHKGRASNSGHYVAWVKRDLPGTKEWLMADDENITVVAEEDVLKLSGGGDWHTAYVLLYGPRMMQT